MITYNILYEKDIDLGGFIQQLESLGVTINFTLPNARIINISSNDTNFSDTSGILVYDEDVELNVREDFSLNVHGTTPSPYYWHQLRCSIDHLPLQKLYLPLNHGDGVSVYVVDTGIDKTHPEFVSSSVIDLWSHNSDFTPQLHGTAVASLIGGSTVGMSKNVILKNVIIPSGTTNVSVILQALDAIIEDHDESNVSVVNCSWSIERNAVLDAKILELQDDNLVVVASAGNYGLDANNYSPVGLNTVLGVGASDVYDRVVSWASSETGSIMNYGPDVDITAPGIDIRTARIVTEEDSDEYGIRSGTSMAAGITSGVVAQYIKSSPSSTAAEIQHTILTSAVEDLLFRDETIYGTTPNLLLQTSASFSPFTNLRKNFTPLEIENGTIFNFLVEYNTELIDHLEIDRFPSLAPAQGDGERFHIKPDWVSLSGDTLTFSPEIGLTSTGKYNIYISGNDQNGVMVYRDLLVVAITDENYQYPFEDLASTILEDSGEVFIQFNNCALGTCPGADCEEKSGFFCTCAGDCTEFACLHYDMKVMVMTQQGERGLVSVEDVRVGDMIEAHGGYTKVTKVVTEHMREGYHIIDNDLKITNDHPFLHNDNWITAEEYDGTKQYIEEVVPTVYISTEAGNFVTYNDSDWIVDSQYGDEYF